MSALVLTAAAPLSIRDPRALRLVEIVTSVMIFYALGFAIALRI
jgi:hypothetical protein